MLSHNTFERTYRRPFGAITCSARQTLVVIATGEHAACHITLRLWYDDRETIVEGTRLGDELNARYVFAFQSPQTPQLVWYYFICESNGHREYLCCENGTNGVSKLCASPGNSFQITVYDKSFDTPKWFLETIVYQIFPDRFARSGKRGGLEYVSTHTNVGRQVYLHEDFGEEVIYFPINGNAHYAPIDFFGGDLAGIACNLPYLAELGVGCVYLNPIFEAVSNHRYDTADYMHVDGMLGGDAAFVELALACDKACIHIMLDGVFSHTGADSVYFNKDGRYSGNGAYNSKDSKYYSWYSFKKFPDEYACWWGFKSLPEVDEDNPDYRVFVKNVIKKWSNASCCSWRLDVADELTDGFIREFRKTLKTSPCQDTPVLIGEVWEDASNKISKGVRRGYVNGDELDGAMNYPLRNAIIDFVMGKSDADRLMRFAYSQQQDYPEPFYYSCLNILGTHDTVRIMTVLGDGPSRDELPVAEQANVCLSDSNQIRAKARVKLAFDIMFAFPGVPCIYYGDEWGMEGMADPFCRRTMKRIPGNIDLYYHVTNLCKMRRSYKALTLGKARFAALGQNVFAVIRQYMSSTVMLVANSGDMYAEVPLYRTLFESDTGKDGFQTPNILFGSDGQKYDLSRIDGAETVRIRPLSSIYLTMR